MKREPTYIKMKLRDCYSIIMSLIACVWVISTQLLSLATRAGQHIRKKRKKP